MALPEPRLAPKPRPWRGLLVAALLAVFAHVAAFFATQQRLTFSFATQRGAPALSTRMVEPKAALPEVVATVPQSAAVSSPQRKAAAPIQKDTQTAAPEAPAAQAPLEDRKIEENQPLSPAKTALDATETVASTSFATPSDVQIDPILRIEPTPNEPKLAYPASAKLQFDGKFARKGSVQTGSGVLSWRTDGRSYVLSLEATALVILSQTETSVGVLSVQGLQPQTYSSKRTGRSEQATHFRGEVGKIQFSNNKPDAPLMAGGQDRLSALMQLAGMLGGDAQLYKTNNRVQMQVAGLDNAEVWEFNVEEEGEIAVPAGALRAIKLSRTPRNEFDRRLEIWLSPQLGYMPIRIRDSSVSSPDQDFVDLVLRTLP